MLQRLNPRPRRILMTVDAVGGVWQYAIALARQLVRHGDTVVLAGLGPAPSSDQRREAESIGPLIWLTTPPDWMASGSADLASFGAEIEPLLHEHDIDLLHLNLPTLAAEVDVPCPVVVVSHSCVVSWFHAVEGARPPKTWAWHEDANRAGFDRADIVIAPSASHAEMLTECYGPIRGLAVVHNAADVTDVRSEDRTGIVAAGRWWDKGKNGAVLDQAAALASEPIICLGPTTGPHGETVGFSTARGVGPVSHAETMQRMAGAVAFVSPSIYEPFGLAALEAANARTPLILSDIPTYRELWDGAALFFPPSDANALAGVINRLVEQPRLQAELGFAAHRRARSYTLEQQAAAMSEVYDRATMQHQERL